MFNACHGGDGKNRMSEIKVSIIVPVYNAENFLTACLESLIGQTMKELEIICVNDGSTDESLEILKEYHKKDARLKVISNSCNMGQPTSRNKAIKTARGKYIQFVDADDFIEKETVKDLFELAEEKNADMCYMGMQIHMEDGLDVKAVSTGISGQYPDIYDGKELLQIFTENHEFFYYTWSVFYRSSFLRENKLLYRELVCGQGGNFIPRCLCKAKRVIVCNKGYYHYRVHNASITHTEKAQKELLYGKIMRYTDMLQNFAQDEKSSELECFLDETYRKLIGGIQGLTYDEKIELESRMPSNFARHIFHILCKEGQAYKIDLSKDMIAEIRKKKYVLIYGAGYASKDVIESMQQNEIEILGFAVTKRKKDKTCLFGHHIYEIQELSQYKEEAIVLVAANKKYNMEIQEILDKNKFKDYIFLNIEI